MTNTLRDWISRIQRRTAYAGTAVVIMSFAALLAGLPPAAMAQTPLPLINQPLVPDAVKPGSAGFTLTLNGTGFVSGSIVNWNGSGRTTTFVSNSQLKADILTSDIAKASTASVTVVNPGPGGGTSNVAFLQVLTPGLTTEFSQSNIAVGTSPQRETTGDFNGDGKLDLAVQDPTGVFVLLGNGDGTFQA